MLLAFSPGIVNSSRLGSCHQHMWRAVLPAAVRMQSNVALVHVITSSQGQSISTTPLSKLTVEVKHILGLTMRIIK